MHCFHHFGTLGRFGENQASVAALGSGSVKGHAYACEVLTLLTVVL